ncbi:DUF4367 domain-containing protein [Paenibacillus sp. GCM10027626]|uniref:DUF4367 domain-containing protein n=1 Tax=Paenibacillus sp. GCM10027626 TaxID=3273411 RepID=UPI00362581C4
MNEIEKCEHEEMKKIVETLYHDIKVPEPSNWDSVRQRLQKNRRRRKWLTRLKIGGCIAAISLLLNLVFSENIPSTYAQVSSFLSNVKNQVIQYFFDSPEENSNSMRGSAKTIPPDDDGNELNTSLSEITTLEMAKGKLSFAPLIPTYMPTSFELDRVRIFQEAGKIYNTVHLEYVADDDSVIQLSEQLIDEQTARIKTDIHEEAGIIKEIKIGNQYAILVDLPDGFVTLEWLTTDRIKIAISGQIPKEEIMKIANNLQ